MGMSAFESCHDNDKEDRVWNFGCSSLPFDLDYIQFSAFTPYDEPWHVTCPGNGVVMGLYSEDNGDKNDRRSFRK